METKRETKRQQLYDQLIQKLLICLPDEEDRILQENEELVDEELISAMLTKSKQLVNEGRIVEAGWLNFLAQQLFGQQIAIEAGCSEVVSKSDQSLSSIPSPDYFDVSYFNFLMQALHIVEQNPSPQVLYPFLSQNQEKLNNRYLGHLLEMWAKKKLSEVESEEAREIAEVIEWFSLLVKQFPHGDRSSNQEIAITGYKLALDTYNFDKSPFAWARIRNRLGDSYLERIKGDKSDNIEYAIKCYQEAVQILSFESFPHQWASLHVNLAIAYADRIAGDRIENLERAIFLHQEALQYFSANKEEHSYEWALAQNNLASTYIARIKENRLENIKKALSLYHESLTIFHYKDFPHEWAVTQYNIATIYMELGNLNESVNAYQEALRVFTYKGDPYRWAQTHTNLGRAYLEKTKENLSNNLARALSHCQQALRMYTPKNHPYEWADTLSVLANVYSKSPNCEVSNINQAIAHYRHALNIFTSKNFPRGCYATARDFGDAAFDRQLWSIAIEGYEKAASAIEQMRCWSIMDTRKEEISSSAINIYFKLVKACINARQYNMGLEYIERSKTRNLVELLAHRDLYPKGGISQSVIDEIKQLRQKIVVEQKRLEIEDSKKNGSHFQPQAILLNVSQLQKFQQQLKEIINNKITPIDPGFILTQYIEPISFKEIQSLIDDKTVIIEWYVTFENIFTFIITPSDPLQPPLIKESTNPISYAQFYLTSYYTDRQQWKNNLETNLQELVKILSLDEVLLLVPSECDHLILIPHRFLHVFPLHALPVSPRSHTGRRARGEGKFLHDLFPRGVQYAPSCQLLKLSQSQQRSNFHNLFAIQNPTEKLIYTDLEVETIRSFFVCSEALSRQSATEEAVKKYPNFSSVHCAHFSCHGRFNPQSPLESALILANKERWTLGEIFELSLAQCRLVTLSACESGFTDFSSLSDEYIGLPNGFLFAGSPSVVSSLWEVDQLSTALLMFKFYETLQQFPERQVGEVAVALQTAQQWLQNLTCQEFERELTQTQFKQAISQLQKKLSPADFFELEDGINNLKKFDPSHKPFASPDHWAAFVAIGV